MKSRAWLAVALAGTLSFGFVSASAETVLEVSPEGPCRDLAAARDEIRARRKAGTLPRGPVTVKVKAGRYAIPEPVRFYAVDGDVKYVAEGPVTLDAGVTLPAGVPVAADAAGAAARLPAAVRGKVRAVDLAPLALKTIEDLRLVGTDGTPYVRARYPNAGWMLLADVEKNPEKNPETGKPRPARRVMYADERIAAWTDEPDIRGVGYPMHDWAPERWRVTRVVPETRSLEVAFVRNGYGFRKGGRWFAENVLRELDVPGECHIDVAGQTLYYLPRPCDEGKGLSLTVGPKILWARGAANLSFEGFRFANARTCAMEFTACTNVVVRGGTIRNTGRAVALHNGIGCRFEKIDAAHFEELAFLLQGGKDMELEKSGNVIAHCRIRDWGRAYAGYSGAVSLQGCGARLTGCDLAESSHAAVFFSGTEHLIDGNEIHDVCLESGEMGAIYTGRNWSYVGNVITGNFFHDIPRVCNQPTRAIMLDDGVGSITIVSNLFVRCAEGVCASGFHNVIEDNHFENCSPAVGLWAAWALPGCFSTNIRNVPRLITTLERAPVDSPVWKARFPWLAPMREAVRNGTLRDPVTRTRVRNNVFVTPGAEQIHWHRERDRTAAGYLIEGNVTVPVPQARVFRAGDRVVFFGDSITHGGKYAEYINLFYATRYPGADVWFSNSGWSGGTLQTGLWSVEEDVTAKRPTVVTLMYGMNDVGRGDWPRFADTPALAQRRAANRATYRTRLKELADRIRAEAGNPELVYLTPSPFDQTCLVDGAAADIVCNDGLALLAEDVRAQAVRENALCVDFQWQMNGCNRRHQTSDPAYSMLREGKRFDRVHPGSAGHLFMAATFLRAQGVDGTVDVIARDAAGAETLSFTCTEKALPFPVPAEGRAGAVWARFNETLNRETLSVTNLAAGRYAVKIDGAEVGVWTDAQLAQGVNLANNPKTPQYRQAVDAAKICGRLWAAERKIRDSLTSRRWMRRHYKIDPDAPGAVEKLIADLEKLGQRNSYAWNKYTRYLVEWPRFAETQKTADAARVELRAAVRPVAHAFELVRVR